MPGKTDPVFKAQTSGHRFEGLPFGAIPGDRVVPVFVLQATKCLDRGIEVLRPCQPPHRGNPERARSLVSLRHLRESQSGSVLDDDRLRSKGRMGLDKCILGRMADRRNPAETAIDQPVEELPGK